MLYGKKNKRGAPHQDTGTGARCADAPLRPRRTLGGGRTPADDALGRSTGRPGTGARTFAPRPIHRRRPLRRSLRARKDQPQRLGRTQDRRRVHRKRIARETIERALAALDAGTARERLADLRAQGAHHPRRNTL